MITLWDNPDSSNGRKVRFLLAELGLDHETQVVPMARPRPDAYMALNPLGGIPTLRDGDLVLTESHAILRHLAAREGARGPLPRRPRRARQGRGVPRALQHAAAHALLPPRGR